MKKGLTTVIGIGAFIIGGLLAQQSALEGIELLEDKVKDKLDKHRPSETPDA